MDLDMPIMGGIKVCIYILHLGYQNSYLKDVRWRN